MDQKVINNGKRSSVESVLMLSPELTQQAASIETSPMSLN